MTIFTENFKKFHYANPNIFAEFAKKTQQLVDAGHQHYGAKATFEAIRWDHDISVKRTCEFKINNNYVSFYVRLLERVYPKYKDFYRKRKFGAER